MTAKVSLSVLFQNLSSRKLLEATPRLWPERRRGFTGGVVACKTYFQMIRALREEPSSS